MVVTDRAMDAVAPLIHEFTYQAMANDLLPIDDGSKYTLRAIPTGTFSFPDHCHNFLTVVQVQVPVFDRGVRRQDGCPLGHRHGVDRRATHAHARGDRQAHGRFQQVLGGQRRFQGVRSALLYVLKLVPVTDVIV